MPSYMNPPPPSTRLPAGQSACAVPVVPESAVTISYPETPDVPAGPGAPAGPAGPAGPCAPRGPLMERPAASLAFVTAWALSCAVPTLLRGSAVTA